MDLVSLETSAENDFIKRRVTEGKVKNTVFIFDIQRAMNRGIFL